MNKCELEGAVKFIEELSKSIKSDNKGVKDFDTRSTVKMLDDLSTSFNSQRSLIQQASMFAGSKRLNIYEDLEVTEREPVDAGAEYESIFASIIEEGTEAVHENEAESWTVGTEIVENYDRTVVENDTGRVYLFGDNIADAKSGFVPKSTQAVIRGLANAVGIPTKKNRGTNENSYFTDKDFNEFKILVDKAIARAKAAGKTIVLPKNGIGTGKAELATRAPKLAAYLDSVLNELLSGKVVVNEFINHSGGAYGSDTEWGRVGSEYGVASNHYYYGEKSSHNAPNGNMEISEEDFTEGKVKAMEAAKATFGYKYGPMKDPRLVRNWAQVKYSDAVFAIGTLVDKGDRLFPNISNDTRTAHKKAVTGGTGYAVEMAIQADKPVYVFNQADNTWYNYDAENKDWVQLKEVPVLTPNFAGIGTRKLTREGKQAIADAYITTFSNNIPNNVPANDTQENTAQTGSTNTHKRPVDESFDEELDKKISNKLKELYPEIKLDYTEEDIEVSGDARYQQSALGIPVVKSLNRTDLGKVREKLQKLYPNITSSDIDSVISKYGRSTVDTAITSLAELVDDIEDAALPYEYAHHYIHWFRDTPIVEEAIKKWGSEEALVQAIGEQVVKQEGEAWSWWNKFVNWLKNAIDLSKADKEEIKNALTDAFLTRTDLRNIPTSSDTTKDVKVIQEGPTTVAEGPILEHNGYKTERLFGGTEGVEIALRNSKGDRAFVKILPKGKIELLKPRGDNTIEASRFITPKDLLSYFPRSVVTGLIKISRSITDNAYDIDQLDENLYKAFGIYPLLEEARKEWDKRMDRFTASLDSSESIQVIIDSRDKRQKIAKALDVGMKDGNLITVGTNGRISDSKGTYRFSGMNIFQMRKVDFDVFVSDLKGVQEGVNTSQTSSKGQGPYSISGNLVTNEGQTNAINIMKDWYRSSNASKTFLLQGRGGTGKTTVINVLLSELGIKPHEVTFAAPTNKAKKVLEAANKNSLYKTSEYYTIAQVLGIRPETDNAGNQIFKEDPYASKPEIGKLLVVDESSMLHSDNYVKVIEAARKAGTKVIFMGDNAQLPPIKDPKAFVKSVVFEGNRESTAALRELMRQSEGSPIIKFTDKLIRIVERVEKFLLEQRGPVEDAKNNLQKVLFDGATFTSMDNNEGVILTDNAFESVLPSFISDYLKSPKTTKYINFNSYTHPNTENKVNLIRNTLFGEKAKEERFIPGEPLMLNAPYIHDADNKETMFDNGEEFTVVSSKIVDKPIKYSIGKAVITTKNSLKVYEIEAKDNVTGKIHTFNKPVGGNKEMDNFIEGEKNHLSSLGKKPSGAYRLKTFVAEGLSHGYVINSHRSQGSTYDNVYMDLGNIAGQPYSSANDIIKSLYVAASRPRKKLVVIDSRSNNQIENPADMREFEARVAETIDTGEANGIIEEIDKCKHKGI